MHILALKVLSIYCILDKELAKKHIMIFFYQFSLEPDDQEIWIIALKGIFDLLLYYGIECFDILQGLKETSTTQNSTRSLYTHEDTITSIHDVKQTKTVQNNYNFIKILTGLLNNEVNKKHISCICYTNENIFLSILQIYRIKICVLSLRKDFVNYCSIGE